MEKVNIDPFVLHVVNSLLDGARTYIEKGEEVSPQIFLVAREKEGNPAMIPIVNAAQFFDSKEMKRLVRPLVKKVWTEFSPTKPGIKLIAVVMLSDAWVEKVELEEGLKIVQNGRDNPFSPKPGTAEALLVQVSVAGAEYQYYWHYVRGRSEVVFGTRPTGEKAPVGLKALVMGLWPL